MDTSPILWVALVTAAGGLVVLIYQAVRYFRRDDSDDDSGSGTGPGS
jgi:hypothetical protein